MSDYNEKEATLLREIKTAVGKEGHDQGNPSDPVYFHFEEKATFQNLAQQVAALIDEQGAEKTCKPLIDVAKNIQNLDDNAFDNATKLGKAFKRAVQYVSLPAAPKPARPATGNPFKNGI